VLRQDRTSRKAWAPVFERQPQLICCLILTTLTSRSA
jgi:hypothetical protein